MDLEYLKEVLMQNYSAHMVKLNTLSCLHCAGLKVGQMVNTLS